MNTSETILMLLVCWTAYRVGAWLTE